MPVEIRPGRPEELQAAGEIVRLAYRADGWGDGYEHALADAAGRAADAEVTVAVEAGIVIGCVTFVRPGTRLAELSRPGEVELRMLGVDPAQRGRGIGEALVRWCLERAPELGAHRVLLSSETGMTGAHRLYQRLGFVRQPQLDWSPRPGLELLAYARDLG